MPICETISYGPSRVPEASATVGDSTRLLMSDAAGTDDSRHVKSQLACGQATESIHTLVDRRMRRQIAVQAEGVRTPIEPAQALKHADRAGRVETGRAHEQDAQFVR